MPAIAAETRAELNLEAWGLMQKIRNAPDHQGPSLYADIVLRYDRHGGGPEIVIETDELSGHALAWLQHIAGQNFEVELHDGKIRLSSPSWSPDRIPF